MIGRLLSTFSPNAYTSRNPAVLESVTEEEHTSGLLFPDPRLLQRSSSSAHAFQTSFNSPNASNTGGYDDRGGLELDVIKDFRIIIAQNAIGDRDEPCILLDSKGTPDSPTQGLGLDPQVFDSSSGRHSRAPSLSQAPSRRGSLQTGQSSYADGGLMSQAASARKIPPPVSSGAFSRARCRNSISSVTSTGESFLETYHNRPSDNGDTGLLNCIFGSSAFSYKGSSTKMHILSTDSDIKGTSPGSREVDALGGRQTPRTLTRAYSSGTQSPGGYLNDRLQQSSKVTILVTRTFSVNLPDSRDTSGDSPDLAAPSDVTQDSSFPFPDFAKRRKIKEKKTPMYAVAITIQVPLPTRNNTRPISSRPNTHGPSGSKQMSFSLDSDPHWSSAFIDDNHTKSSGLDDRIDLLVDHWDVITRTLSYLEKLARREILVLLKRVDAQVSQAPKPNVPKAMKMPNMQRTNQTIIQLRPNVLAYNSKLKEELLLNAQRISAALRIPRVVLGQSRWGVWREEARWVARLMADKEHGLFFLVLITAFLGNHTEWLDSLGPEWYRKRHQMQQKSLQDLEPAIPSRTVIVSDNKMVARRLIFILSAFLPAKHRFDYVNSPMRPGTSTSNRPLSQSPPTFPLLRQESLRRKVNKRARAQRLNTEEADVPQRSGSVSSIETAHKNGDEVEQPYQADSPISLSHRRDSDVRSITAASLPIHATDARTRATTSTTNNSAIPVPHFTSRRRIIQDDSERARVDTNDSYASAKLLQNLRRSETNMSSDGNAPTGGTKWVGNILSGFWTGRPNTSRESDGVTTTRRASLAHTPTGQSRIEDDEIRQSNDSPQTEISSKVPGPSATAETISITQSSTTPKKTYDHDDSEIAPTENVKDSPLKLLLGDDGIVDVDLPLRGFLSLSSSNDSTLTSPKKARTSVTSMDVGGSMQSSFTNTNCGLKDNESPTLNVGGWLKNFHEDFLVQAVRPYHGIEADIKRAMQAEPIPPTSIASLDNDNASITDRWVEVASTLIADTRTCNVKRIRLLRKVNMNPTGSAGVASPSTLRQAPDTPSSTTPFPGFFSSGRSRKGSVATLAESIDLDEAETKFVEEPVVDVDGTLVDAIERVLIQSGQSSLAHSRAPSPHRNSRFDERERPGDDTPPVVEVPRNECRKTVLGALEEVARTVAEDYGRDYNDTDFSIDPTDKGGKRRPFYPDNTLREGVRKWLLDIEEAA